MKTTFGGVAAKTMGRIDNQQRITASVFLRLHMIRFYTEGNAFATKTFGS
ncbi:MAG: hypothetical protein ACXW32_05280 [Limisphaerales bacterium]